MVDHLSPERRSWNMGRIRSKDTSPELRVRSMIHRAGYRYRLHAKAMPGKPDIVMRRHRIVVFVNGCFWHRHEGCRYATTPGSNAEYWRRKFERTVARDRESREALGRDGWKVLIIWECQTRDGAKLANLLAEILPPRG